MDSSLLAHLPSTLQSQITTLTTSHPPSIPTITALLKHFQPKPTEVSSHIAKKRKLSPSIQPELHLHTIHSISFISPARKKWDLNINQSTIHLTAPTDSNPAYMYPLSTLTHLFILPTPNKSKPHYTIVLRSRDTQQDPIIFGFDDRSSNLRITSTEGEEKVERIVGKTESAREKVGEVLKSVLTDVEIIQPSSKVFEARSKKHTYHVDCYLKAKEGHLYFLPTGILYGFKKPLLYYPFSHISGLDIISPTGHTFNLLLSPTLGNPIEFAMISTCEAEAVLQYIERHKRLFGKCVITTSDGMDVDQDEGGQQQGGDEEEEEDDDFVLDSDAEEYDAGLREEYDSGHETDSAKSGKSDEGGEEEESESDDDEEGKDEEEEEQADEQGDTLQKFGKFILARSAVDDVVGAVEEAFGLPSGGNHVGGESESENDSDDDESGGDVEEEEEEEEEIPEKIPKGMAALAAQIERERKAKVGSLSAGRGRGKGRSGVKKG